ncbi:MAG TPA: AraC family transcriptional regulator [Oscillospiraceae bacterium]|nr:AraC family transcriptional regulator [Oscillospiraceae bacterium]HPS34465.1 AraC family transcriptional regulator [Oscillospiraceae bacterium]
MTVAGNLLSIGRMDVPTYLFGAHKHDFWEVAYYCDGVGTNTIGGVEWAFSPGTVICQPPEINHEERAEQGYKNYFVSVKSIGALSDRTVPVVFCDTASGDFFNIIRQLYYECRINGHEQIAAALTEAFVAYITVLGRGLAKKNPYVEQFEHTLAANLSNPEFNLTEAAKKLPFSLNHFRGLFERQTGLSPKRFLLRMRIEQAKSLLGGNSLPVGDIGRMCGFSDPYYFSRIFKAETGLPPSEFRLNR